jgi:cell shape-determining protein MreC
MCSILLTTRFFRLDKRFKVMHTDERMPQKTLYNFQGERDAPKRVTASLPQRDYSRLEEIAYQKRVSIAWVIREAVTEYIHGVKDGHK